MFFTLYVVTEDRYIAYSSLCSDKYQGCSKLFSAVIGRDPLLGNLCKRIKEEYDAQLQDAWNELEELRQHKTRLCKYRIRCMV